MAIYVHHEEHHCKKIVRFTTEVFVVRSILKAFSGWMFSSHGEGATNPTCAITCTLPAYSDDVDFTGGGGRSLAWIIRFLSRFDSVRSSAKVA